jgi:riboflavin kinase/FMN adenylyltransferase
MTVIQGIVEHGDERGRTLGFPTANIQLSDDQIEDGVWAAVIRTDSGKSSVAAVSVGRRRTFYAQEGNRLLEAHLLDFNDDLYGQKLTVALAVKLRDQQAFPSVDALAAQLRRDVAATRNWAQKHYPWLVPPETHHEGGAALWPEQLPRTLAAAQ